MSVQYPNKTFVLETTTKVWKTKRKHIVIVAAKNKETAAQHLSIMLGGNVQANDLTWLMNTNHTTMYDQSGNKELNVQAKILYNTTIIIK